MKVSDYIVDYFQQKGVNVIFGYIGGMITHIVDSIGRRDDMQFVQVYHEQTASMAAEGYARESGKFGVAIATSGPGATNMMTGIADAYFDSIPVVYITGQVNVYEYKYNKKIRQQGFQETDVVTVVTPITKYAKLVDDSSQICFELEKAVYIATHGRKGPVLLDIPMNIQRMDITVDLCDHFKNDNITDVNIPKDDNQEVAIRLIQESKRPMILLGGGGHGLESVSQIEELIKKTNFPVVTSLLGRGIIDETYSNYIGMIGSYGNRCANISIANADLILVLGSRLDTRQTGAKFEEFAPNATLIHVDIDNDELQEHRLKNRIKINQPIEAFLIFLNSQNLKINIQNEWIRMINHFKNCYSQDQEIERFIVNKSPYKFFQTFNTLSSENDVFCVDIGQTQMWAAQTIRLKTNQKFYTSGGLAPMGIAIPTAIGIAFANQHKNVFAIAGDGGFHISVQSLLLISQYRLPVKIIIMNNQSLGLITQFQHLYFEDRHYATISKGGYLIPDIENMAKSYRIPYYKMNESDLADLNLLNKIGECKYCIIDYYIDFPSVVSPKLEYDKPIYQMSPLLPNDEYQNNIIKHS